MYSITENNKSPVLVEETSTVVMLQAMTEPSASGSKVRRLHPAKDPLCSPEIRHYEGVQGVDGRLQRI